MANNFTIADVLKSACGGRNQHLLNPGKVKGKSKALPKPKDKTKMWIELVLQTWCDANGYTLVKEHKFHAERKWRLDYAIMKDEIIIAGYEYNGIMSKKSRHTSVLGYTGDMEKINAVQKIGFPVFQYTILNYKNLSADLASIKTT